VTSTFFTRGAACEEQLQFVLISSTKLSPGFLSAEISAINSYRRNNSKSVMECENKTPPRLSIPPSYLTIWSGLLAFKPKNYIRRQELWGAFGGSPSVKVGGEGLSDIFHVVPIFLK
jgi:hypothetical protein